MNATIIFLAIYLVYLIAAITVVAGWVAKTNKKEFWWWLVKLGVSFVLAYISVKLLNYFIPEIRPFVVGNFQPIITHANDPSFPSDHATISAVMAAFVWQLKRNWGMIVLALAILVGVGRVSAGVHYWWDVAAGLALGIVIALIVTYLWPRRSA